jgi:bifunctional UDP-N-acetylglucosamine pyrophosphorylase/glucosamine-1-phosphate N-acetyltransferase
MPIAAVILAAGKGTRFKSHLAKVLHPLLGRPMLHCVLDLAAGLQVDRTILVVGHQAEAVRAACAGYEVEFAFQAEQLGTGHAVASAAPALAGFAGDVLILSGDVPLLKPATLAAFVQEHARRQAKVSFMWARVPDPTGYGRLVREAVGPRIVEHKDATPEQLEIKDINVGLYLVQAGYLFQALQNLKPENAQGEYYLPDVVNLAHDFQVECRAVESFDPEEVLGVNDRAQLAQAEARLRRVKVEGLMRAGVSCQDPAAVYLDHFARVGPDSSLGAGVHLLGRTTVGQGAVIEPHCYLRDCQVGDGATILFGSRLIGRTISPGEVVDRKSVV